MGGLAARAVAGDTEARDTLLGQVRVVVHRYCRARLGRLPGSEHAADDVAQEVCLAVLSALPRYRDEGRPFEAFVFGIAAHKVVDAQRAAGRAAVPTEDLPETADTGLGPEDHAVRSSDAATVRAAARPAAAAPARAAAAARRRRPLRRGDRRRARHDLRRRPGRPAPGAHPAAHARRRGGGVMITPGRAASWTSPRSPPTTALLDLLAARAEVPADDAVARPAGRVRRRGRRRAGRRCWPADARRDDGAPAAYPPSSVVPALPAGAGPARPRAARHHGRPRRRRDPVGERGGGRRHRRPVRALPRHRLGRDRRRRRVGRPGGQDGLAAAAAGRHPRQGGARRPRRGRARTCRRCAPGWRRPRASATVSAPPSRPGSPRWRRPSPGPPSRSSTAKGNGKSGAGPAARRAGPAGHGDPRAPGRPSSQTAEGAPDRKTRAPEPQNDQGGSSRRTPRRRQPQNTEADRTRRSTPRRPQPPAPRRPTPQNTKARRRRPPGRPTPQNTKTADSRSARPRRRPAPSSPATATATANGNGRRVADGACAAAAGRGARR